MIQRFLILILAAFTLTFVACKSDSTSTNTNTGNNTNSTGSVTAKVDGAAWSATTIQSTWSNNALGIGASQISTSDNKQINLSGMVPTVGTYQINPMGGIIAMYSEGSGTSVQSFMGSSGTLVVEQLSSTGAKGTFSFQANATSGTGSRALTQGAFNVVFK